MEQIKLLGGLSRDELHGRALDCFGDRLGVAEGRPFASFSCWRGRSTAGRSH
jgi:hypothetical protein